jgi:predicted AlkP superfamily pyrophosphatase or phosphodiesterase
MLPPLVGAWLSSRNAARSARNSSIGQTSGIALSVLILVGLAAPWRGQPDKQLILIGLDGATWGIIDQLRESGRLPTFDRLIKQGARGDLDVLRPVISPPLWTSIATGMRSEKHGIKDFFTSSNHVQAKRLWEIADENGMVSGVLGYLVTWPPAKESGFLVPGWLAQGPETFPSDLSFLKRLEISEKKGEGTTLASLPGLAMAALRHGVTLETFTAAGSYFVRRLRRVEGPDPTELEGRLLKLYLTRDVFRQQLRKYRPQLAIYYYSSIDAIQHMFFKYYDPKNFPDVTADEIASLGGTIPKIYAEADDTVRRILDVASPDAHVMIVSDHGQRAATEERGEWIRIRSESLVSALGLQDTVRSTNVGSSVYVRPFPPEPDVTRAIELFRSIKTVEGGEPVFLVMEPGHEDAIVTLRPLSNLTPDLLVDVQGRNVPLSEFIDMSGRISGVHTETAVMLMSGPNVIPGKQLARGSILDIAPTALYLLGLPVARDMDGRVLDGAIRPEVMAERSIEHIDTYGIPESALSRDEDQELRESTLEELKSLGYIN